MQKEVREALRIRFKLAILEYGRGIGSVTKACREFKVPRSTFYEWKKVFEKEGKAGLAQYMPILLLIYYRTGYITSFPFESTCTVK